jgi:hypothetical protein
LRFYKLSRTLCAFCTLAVVYAQQAPDSVTVPRLIRYAGTYHSDSQKLVGALGVRFSIYREQEGGTPLWTEIQNVQPDKDGSYAVLLGSTQREGVPVELFIIAEPRWLEVEIDQFKQPRILLGSVPYAFKAADADTLGGLPASAYLRSAAPAAVANGSQPATASSTALMPQISNGTPNYVGMFSNSTDLVNSVIYQGSPSTVSVGGTASLGALTLIGNVPGSDAPGMALYNQGGGGGASVSLDMYNTPFNSGIPQAKVKAVDDGAYSDHLTFWTKTPGGAGNPVAERLRITSSGNVGIGTTTPVAKLEVNGNMMVDGNINVTGSIQAGSSGPVFQVPNNGTSNLGIGLGAMQLNPTGSGNTGVGDNSLSANSTGGQNTALGTNALKANSSASGNTAIGWNALASNTLAAGNTAVGYNALSSNTVGTSNTAFGFNAMPSNISGSNNLAIGSAAMDASQSGSDNTAVGNGALNASVSGAGNTAIGINALVQSLNSNNIAIGLSAGNQLVNGSNNIYIANAGANTESGVIRIGTAGLQSTAFIAGVRGTTTGAANAIPVMIDSNGQLGTMSSSARFKEDIHDMGEASDRLFDLRPVTFRYKQHYSDGSQPIEYGLIAEEVEQVYPDLVVRSNDGQIETVQYQKLTPLLLNEVKKLNKQNQVLESEIQMLKAQVNELLAR